MSELTEHQRSIMRAVLLGLEIEVLANPYEIDCDDGGPELYLPVSIGRIFELFAHDADDILRIKPGQNEKVVRLYGDVPNSPQSLLPGLFAQTTCDAATHYIDINPETGVIVGGRL